MLRITTDPPPPHEHKDGEGSGTEDEVSPPPTNIPAVEVTEVRGLLGSTLRPGFLRGLGRSRSTAVANADVESQLPPWDARIGGSGLGRVGA